MPRHSQFKLLSGTWGNEDMISDRWWRGELEKVWVNPKRRMAYVWDLNKQLGKITFCTEHRTPGNASGQDWLGTRRSKWLELRAQEQGRWGCVKGTSNSGSGTSPPQPGDRILPRKPHLKLCFGIFVLRKTALVWACPALPCLGYWSGCCGVFELIIGPRRIFWDLMGMKEPLLTIKTFCRLQKNVLWLCSCG